MQGVQVRSLLRELRSHMPCGMAAAAKCFSCVQLSATPETAHQGPPSLGFSRQEHWSGLPFPSPMQESEKWKGSHSVVSYSLRPHGLQPTRLLRPWDFPGKSTGVGVPLSLHSWHDSLKPGKSLSFMWIKCFTPNSSAPRKHSLTAQEKWAHHCWFIGHWFYRKF